MTTARSFGRRRLGGFTLTEIMIAMTIMSLATVGIVAFTRNGLKMYYMDRARTMVNRDIRSFTAQLDNDAVTANCFFIYPDFNTTSSGGVDASVADGQVGDFLLLAYTDPASSNLGISMVTRFVGYYREITDATLNTGPVHRFDTDASNWPNSDKIPAGGVDIKNKAMYLLLADYVKGSASSYPIVTQLAQGLAQKTDGTTTTTPRLFYNFLNRSIMIDTQIAESLSETGTASQTGNTYNFAVSPRG